MNRRRRAREAYESMRIGVVGAFVGLRQPEGCLALADTCSSLTSCVFIFLSSSSVGEFLRPRDRTRIPPVRSSRGPHRYPRGQPAHPRASYASSLVSPCVVTPVSSSLITNQPSSSVIVISAMIQVMHANDYCMCVCARVCIQILDRDVWLLAITRRPQPS